MIYKKCIMTINKNNATLDEDIYLFRLDKNIELHFSIVNNRYKFDKSDLNNIIAQTNAAYFQIRLYRSDEIKYTFAIQPTQDGVAVLTITDDLINDPIEVGEYDFQISLLDADKTSMISMPIVKQQLHVCEPLVDNQAIMGRAVLGLSSLASGEIKNAFDSEGNYIREIHNDGDILSAQLINKFEEALDTNTKAIKNSKDTDLPHTVSSKVLVTVPASDITLQKAININNVSINKDRRYYIEFLGSKKLCGVMVNKEISNSIVCSIDGYVIQVFNEATDLTIFITNTNTDDTPISTDLAIYEEEVKYLDSKYLETDLVAQNSISMGRTGDIGMASVAIGVGVEASGNGSFAEGGGTKASNDSSHAEGTNTTASGNSSHAEGYGSLASGYGSHAEGSTTTASGASSHAEGYGSKASSQFQHVQGKYNIEDKNRKYAHIVGNGAGDAKRSNAHTLDWQGNAWYSGKLTQEGTPTEDKDLATKKYVDDNILLEQLPILRIDETNKRIYVNCNNMGTYKKYFVPNKYANVYGFSFIYTNEDSSETEIALVGGAITRDDFILCARNTDTLFILILGGTDKYTYTKSTKTLEKRLYGYLKIGNTQEYTPTENYHPATKKYVDDNLTTLKEGITTSDAELIDGRTGANGVTYKNIGDAIRTQCGNLNTLLDIYYETISNNRIDDSKFVGKNFDTLIGHNGNNSKTFTLDAKLKSKRIKGFIEFEDGTSPDTNNGFFWSLKCSTGEVDNLTLSVTGTLVASDNYAKYDQVVIGSWATYDKNIKTFFIGDYADEYDNFKTRPKSKAINTMESKIRSIAPEQCTFFTKVDNLLKNVTLQKEYAINPSYGLPDSVPGKSRTSTDYMELRDGCESTYCNTNGYIYYYDESKNFLKSITPQSSETPAGIVALPQSDTKIKYIRYTFVTTDDAKLATYWITDQGKPYENDKLYIPKDRIEDMSKTESWYKGKKICAYGDSVTEQNKWQAYVASYFGCSFYNRGVGGTTVTQVNSSTNHMSADIRIETIPTDSDVILVFGGHNDWSSASINMGDIKTDELSESVSFKAAFALMLKKIQTRCPSAKIITMTPVGGRTEEAAINQDKQFYIRDLCMTDFANAVKEVSAYYGIPCIDINANSGINTLNHTTYIADLIHPNVEGGKLIANEVINGLKRFEPIVF